MILEVSDKERVLIDRYLDNSLSGVELKEFMDRLENDEQFRKVVSFHNLLVESIQDAENSRLENNLIELINYKKPLIPSALKLILIFLAITFVGITLWEYIGPGTSNPKNKLFSFEIFKKKSEKVDPEKQIIKKELKSTPKTIENGGDSVEDQNAAAIENTFVDSKDSGFVNNPTGSDQNLEVKKDQLLVAHTFKVQEVTLTEKKVEVSLSQSTVSKLNPAAGLVENPKVENYEVEFWISPINYKGYKMANNKLVLFGIEEPEAVKLFLIENKIVMKYGHEFFKISNSDDFVSFTSIKPSDLPLSIR